MGFGKWTAQRLMKSAQRRGKEGVIELKKPQNRWKVIVGGGGVLATIALLLHQRRKRL